MKIKLILLSKKGIYLNDLYLYINFKSIKCERRGKNLRRDATYYSILPTSFLFFFACLHVLIMVYALQHMNLIFDQVIYGQ